MMGPFFKKRNYKIIRRNISLRFQAEVDQLLDIRRYSNIVNNEIKIVKVCFNLDK